jgi:hypothetical protein
MSDLIRQYSGDYIGTTCRDRNPLLYAEIAKEVGRLGPTTTVGIIGCSTGEEVEALYSHCAALEAFPTIIACDPCEDFREAAKASCGKYARVEPWALLDWAEPVDIMVCHNVMCYVPEYEKQEAIEHLHKHTKHTLSITHITELALHPYFRPTERLLCTTSKIAAAWQHVDQQVRTATAFLYHPVTQEDV